MGTALTGSLPKNTYLDLLKLSHAGAGLDSTLRAVGDGAGNDSPLALSTNALSFTGVARTSGVAPYLTVTAPADTTLTAGTEAIGVSFVGATRQHATNAITTQREFVFAAPTYSFVGASTITNAVTLDVTAPTAGTNATLTNKYAIQANGDLAVTSGRLLVTSSATNQNTYQIAGGGDATGFAFRGTGNNTIGVVMVGSSLAGFSAAGLCLASGAGIGFSATAGGGGWISTLDTSLTRAAAGVFGQAAGTWLQATAGRSRVAGDVTNATITMANITGLSATLLAGRKYSGRVILYANNSVAAEGLAFDFDGGACTATSFQAGVSSSPPGVTVGTLTSTALATDLTVTVATTADGVYVIEFSIVVNAAGTFIPRFSEVSHTTGTATIRLGSWAMVEDIP